MVHARLSGPRPCPGGAGTTAEITNVLRALDGRFIEPGPSGSPTRGLVSVVPPGRKTYSADPHALPLRTTVNVRTALLEPPLARHRSASAWRPSKR